MYKRNHVAMFISAKQLDTFECVCVLHQVLYHDAAWSPQFLKVIIKCIEFAKSLSFIS